MMIEISTNKKAETYDNDVEAAMAEKEEDDIVTTVLEENVEGNDNDNDNGANNDKRCFVVLISLLVLFCLVLMAAIIVLVIFNFKSCDGNNNNNQTSFTVDVYPNDDGLYCISPNLAQTIQDDILTDNEKNVILQLENFISNVNSNNTNNTNNQTTLVETLHTNGTKTDDLNGRTCYKINDPVIPEDTYICLQSRNNECTSLSRIEEDGVETRRQLATPSAGGVQIFLFVGALEIGGRRQLTTPTAGLVQIHILHFLLYPVN